MQLLRDTMKENVVVAKACGVATRLIRARKTLGAADPPEAVIVIDGGNYVFNGTQWDRPFPAIQVFDVPFIHANILSHEIGHEHKKNIHKVIIGEKGKRLGKNWQ